MIADIIDFSNIDFDVFNIAINTLTLEYDAGTSGAFERFHDFSVDSTRGRTQYVDLYGGDIFTAIPSCTHPL